MPNPMSLTFKTTKSPSFISSFPFIGVSTYWLHVEMVIFPPDGWASAAFDTV